MLSACASVVFTVVDNHHYKTKAGERKDEATFFNCTYWLSTAIAPHLKKGSIVTLFGRVGINSYKNKDNDFIAYLTFHANNIKIVAGGKRSTLDEPIAVGIPVVEEDLPF